MSYLERLKAARRLGDHGSLPAICPGTALTKLTEPPFGSFGSACSGHSGENDRLIVGIPDAILDGLAHLKAMPEPRLTHPQLWPVIVADALRLARCTWAARALALGWQPLDLWGCWPFDGGDDRRDGLVVWLDGRTIVALDERIAIARQDGSTAYYYRSSPCGERVFLWAIGGEQ